MNYQTRKGRQVVMMLITSIFLLSSFVLAQTPPISGAVNKDDEPTCILPTPELVYIWVTLKAPKRRLKVEDFYLTENGNRQYLDVWLQLPQKKKNIGQYKMGYYSTDVRRDGKTRKIQVTVRTKEGKQLNIEYWPKSYQAKTISS